MSEEREQKTLDCVALAADYMFVEDVLSLSCVAKAFAEAVKRRVSYLNIRTWDENLSMWSIGDLAARFPFAQHLTFSEECKIEGKGRDFCQEVKSNFTSLCLRGKLAANKLTVPKEVKGWTEKAKLNRIRLAAEERITDGRRRGAIETLLLGLASESVKHLVIKGPSCVLDRVDVYRCLETLSVHGEPQCGSLACEDMPSLKSLEINLGPFCLTTLRIAPRLELLRMKGTCSCTWLMEVVAPCSESLRHLSLTRSAFQSKDDKLQLQCPSLESLELTQCTGLRELTLCAPLCRIVKLDDDVDLEFLTVDSHALGELQLDSLVSLKSLYLRKPYPPDVEAARPMWPELALKPI
jgi:hypothetical protein